MDPARVVLACLLLVCACAQEAEERPDVVLVVVDTLRADRLSFHGCPQDNAPFLSELAQRSLVFENAWSPSSWTLPSAVSVVTSVLPSQHGVTSLAGLELGPDDEPVPVNCIPAEVETLAETLRKSGYRTFGVVSNVLVGSEVGFDRGFDRFVKLEDEDADAVNAVVADWTDELLGGGPFFLYVHYFDPHDTYHARDPWFDGTRSGVDGGWTGELPEQVPHTYTDLEWFMTRLEPQPDWLVERRAQDLSTEDLHELVKWVRAAYDSEIGYVDSRIAALYQALGLDDAIVFFLADHGEEFYEHGDLTHGNNLYAETVRVPLLLQLPGQNAPRGRVSRNVTTLDIVPTLRGLLALPASSQDIGHDLLAETAPRPILGLLSARPGENALDGDLRSIVLGNYRLISAAGGKAELYDVSADPQERRNLADELPEVVARLHQELERALQSAPAYPPLLRIPGAPSEAMLEHLRGIGYAGGD